MQILRKKMRQCKRDKKLPKGFCFDLGYSKRGGWRKPNGHKLELGEEEGGDQP